MILEAININKNFDDHKVLDNVSLSLDEASITGLVGRNGSGKTTLLKILAGIYKADSGKSKIDGNSLEINPQTIEKLAYLPDRFDYFNHHKVKDIIDYYDLIYPKFDKKFFLDETNKHGYSLDQGVRNLSKGEKNLLGLITMLATNAQVLLVDEVLDGMDVLNKRLITEYLLDARDKGCAVFASSHQLSELTGICDEILYLTKDGHISSTQESSNKNHHKLQIVVKDDLPHSLKNRAVILSNIGRVYTVIIDGEDDEIRKLLNDNQIVQFDNLEMKVEDYFYLEEGVR